MAKKAVKTTPPVSKAAKKAAPAAQEPAGGEKLDSRGRRIGARGQALEDGVVLLTGAERRLLKDIASRAVSNKGVSAFDRALALGVGEADVALGTSIQSFAMSLAQARRAGTLNGREFNYTTAPFSPGVGLPAISVLWIERTA